MSCEIEKTSIYGKIVCPSNKSYTHRAILLATLVDGKSVIKNVLLSKDTRATIRAAQSFGALIQEAGKNITVKGLKEFKVHNAVIDAENSGTTIRIAAAIAALSEGKTVLSGDESLRQRPMQPLLDALESIGAKCSSKEGNPPITVIGKVKGGEVTIPGNISSQFISALMIIAPKTEKGIVLNIKEDLVSKPYLDATIIAMKKFGANVETITPYQKYNILPQKYKPSTITIPSDFSSLAMLLCAAVLLGDELTIEMTMGDLPQGDEKIIDILEILGVVVTLSKNTITVKSPDKLDGGKFDLKDTPDLLPPLAILALKTSKPIELFNVKHARYKETDRISILARELPKLGIKVKEKEDGLILDSSPKLKGAHLNSENDHRLFMAFCMAGMFVGNCTVSNPESIDISYPDFISDMNKVGGKIKTPVEGL
jgi:3-phosphoshikimate 1-carboxyvinyltransferase